MGVADSDSLNYTGLVIYGIGDENCIASGIYVWERTKWVSLKGEYSYHMGDILTLVEMVMAHEGEGFPWPSLNWHHATPFNLWEGVTFAPIADATTGCIQTRVVGLNLKNSKIYMLGENFAKLTELQSLNLKNNKIEEFPIGFEKIEINYIDISSNCFGTDGAYKLPKNVLDAIGTQFNGNPGLYLPQYIAEDQGDGSLGHGDKIATPFINLP